MSLFWPADSPPPLLLFGPTASGKSALALALAQDRPSLVLNADASQVYDGWRILTARPGPDALAAAPHALYGHIGLARSDYSVGVWLSEVAAHLERARSEGRRPILVGGAGLYFTALTRGLAAIPPIPEAIRAAAARRAEGPEAAALAQELRRRDPETAARLDLSNPRRVARAWAVLEATGVGLSAWKARTPPPLLPPEATARVRFTPDAAALAERIDARLRAMVGGGALEEVRAVEARKASPAGASEALPPDAPGLKALGAAELSAHLRAETSLEDAILAAAAATRQYAKRQRTWGRNQLADWPTIDPLAPDALAQLRALAARNRADRP